MKRAAVISVDYEVPDEGAARRARATIDYYMSLMKEMLDEDANATWSVTWKP